MSKGVFIDKLFIFLISVCTSLSAQTTGTKKNADRYFEAGDYFDALSLYSDILQNDPKNPELNYKYGVCLFYTDSVKSNCLKYLFLAANQSQPIPLSVYYLARAYHLNYKFDEAI
jgi:predicted Zn-dependent protease